MSVCFRCGKTIILPGTNRKLQLCQSCYKADKKIFQKLQKQGRNVVFFKNGVLYDCLPKEYSHDLYSNRDLAYNPNTVIVSDGDVYDPEVPATISNLRIPTFPSFINLPSVTMDLSYIMKMRCSLMTNPEFLPLFVEKTLALFDASPIGWLRGDYLRVIRNYYILGMFEEGDQFEAEYRKQNITLFGDPFAEAFEGDHLTSKYYFESKWRRDKEYTDLRNLLPEIVPDTYKGYSQIRSRKTKRFREIAEQAQGLGYSINPHIDYHYCRKNNCYVKMKTKYDKSGKSPRLIYCECPLHAYGKCSGRNEYGLLCVYPSTGYRKVEFYIGNDPNSQLSKSLNFALNERLFSVGRMSEKMGVSSDSARMLISHLLSLRVLSHDSASSYYRIAISYEEAIKQYGHITDQIL